MLILKLTLALGILIAVIFGAHRIHRELSGRGNGGGLVSAGIRRARDDGSNDLERFISEYRAQTAQASLAPGVMDRAREHTIGVDLHQPGRKKVMAGPRGLVFLLLKTTLPDHHLLPNARLGDFIQNLPTHMAAQRVDFLVCSRSFEPVSVIDLLIENEPVESREARSALSSQLGIRYVELRTQPLPKPDDIRQSVLG